MIEEKYNRLRSLLAEVTDLEYAVRLLDWDEQTHMPKGGAEGRANMLATLNKIRHARFTSDELGRLLGDLLPEVESLDPDGDEARIVKVTKREYDRERKLPERLVEEMSRASSAGFVAWRQAKEAKDYSLFAPSLKRNIEISREVAEALGYDDRPYDALFDRFEPGVTTAQLETIFSELKAAIVPMVREIAARQDAVDAGFLYQHYDQDAQLKFGLSIGERFGYDLDRGRLDLSAHPFAMPLGLGDVRITTRVDPNYLDECLSSITHECGHAMYEQGVSPTLEGTPLCGGASPGVHESQSRLWENLVGRSRAFQDYLFPRLQEAFPAQLGSVNIEDFYKAFNKVQPSLIRTSADEVTYNLHILLRFELENEMLEDKVSIDGLNKVWDERMSQYFGITPPNDSEGVLQDIHWSAAGWLGSFPGYTLGNIIGAQLFEQAHKEIPDLNGRISRGEFAGLLGWLQTNVYRHGRKFTANELTERITGEPVGTKAWINYVRTKYSDIYGL